MSQIFPSPEIRRKAHPRMPKIKPKFKGSHAVASPENLSKAENCNQNNSRPRSEHEHPAEFIHIITLYTMKV